MDGGGPIGNGREAPPDVTLTRCDEEAIVSSRQHIGADMIIALPFIVIGLSFGIVMIYQSWLLKSYFGVIISPWFGLGFAAMGYYMIAPFSLHIDVATRTYKYTFGWRPLRKVKEGRWEDFERLSVRTYFRSSAGRDTTLFLHWRNRRRQPFPLYTAYQEEARQQGLVIASVLNLPFVDEKEKPVRPSSVPPA